MFYSLPKGLRTQLISEAAQQYEEAQLFISIPFFPTIKMLHEAE